MAYSLLLDAARVPCNSAATRDFLSEKTVTASLAGSGLVGATILVRTSSDGRVWNTAATITLSGTDSASDSATISTSDEYTDVRLDKISGSGAAVTASLEAVSAAAKATYGSAPTMTYKATDDSSVDVAFGSEVFDPDLQVDAGANETWEIEAFLAIGGTGQLVALIEGPAGSAGMQNLMSFAGQQASAIENSCWAGLVTAGNFPIGYHAPTLTSDGGHVRIKAVVKTSSTAGAIGLRWGNAGGSVLTMKQYSWLRGTKVS